MADKTAFALKDGVDNFVDAAVAAPPDGKPLSVGELLKDGKGVIVTEDENEAAALATVDVLKEVPASKVAEIRKQAAKGGQNDKDGGDR